MTHQTNNTTPEPTSKDLIAVEEEASPAGIPFMVGPSIHERIRLAPYAMQPKPLKELVNTHFQLAGVMTYDDYLRDQQGQILYDAEGVALPGHTTILKVRHGDKSQVYRTQSAAVYDWISRTLRPFLGLVEQGDFPENATVPVFLTGRRGKNGQVYHLLDFYAG